MEWRIRVGLAVARTSAHSSGHVQGFPGRVAGIVTRPAGIPDETDNVSLRVCPVKVQNTPLTRLGSVLPFTVRFEKQECLPQ